MLHWQGYFQDDAGARVVLAAGMSAQAAMNWLVRQSDDHGRPVRDGIVTVEGGHYGIERPAAEPSLGALYEILGRSCDTGESDLAERHNEHQP